MSADANSALLNKIDDLRRSSAESAGDLVARVFRDGVVTRAEADALFVLNDRLSRRTSGWDKRFITAVSDFLLQTEAPQGWISDQEADWLMAHLQSVADAPREVDVDLLVTVLRKADGAPPRLGLFALQLSCARIIAKGQADEAETERVRGALYAPGGAGGLWVTRDEAQLLFKTNDAVANARNAKSWGELFARAIGNHLLAASHPDPDTELDALRRESWLESDSGGVFAAFGDMLANGDWFERLTWKPGQAEKARNEAREAAQRSAERIEQQEEDWVLRRLGWDNRVSPAERTLLDFLAREAPGLTAGLAALNEAPNTDRMDKS